MIIKILKYISMLLLIHGIISPNLLVNATSNNSHIFDCTQVIDVPIIECEALVSIFESTNGYNWHNNSNWFASNRVDDWYGISTSSGHVTRIILNQNNLTGILTEEIGYFPGLLLLGLWDNNISGNLPSELGYLTKLRGLRLEDNNLTGSIPSELGNVVKLEHLKLQRNQLSGCIPPNLGKLNLVRALDFSDNNLSCPIPSEMGNLSSVGMLFLSQNNLSGDVPSTLSNLTMLGPQTGLDLGYNKLNVPSDYPAPGNSFHEFLYIKDPNWHLTQTSDHSFNCNQLIDIPINECEALVSLFEDTSGHNWYYKTNWLISRRIDDWFGVTVTSGSVTELILEGNNLTGTISAEIGNLSSIERLFLSQNNLSGDVPSTLSNLTMLGSQTGLDLGYNKLNVPSDYPAPGNSFHEFLYSKDPNWHFTQTQVFTTNKIFLPIIVK